MAREQESIKQLMDTQQAAETSLSVLNNPSQTAIFGLEKDVIAYVMANQETLWDILRDDIEAQLAAGAVGSEAWIQDKVFKFQYDATNPQILQLVNFAPNYPIINSELCPITRCSVKTDLNKIVKIKVASSDPPAPISLPEYSSLVGYLKEMLGAGIDFDLVNIPSDKLYVSAEVFYDGQYTSSIQSNVEAAINAYLAAIPFDGLMRISSLEDAIQSVPGVVDIKLKTVKARQDSVVLALATTIYDVITSATNARVWDTVSGYMVEEDTVGNTFADTITYTVNS